MIHSNNAVHSYEAAVENMQHRIREYLKESARKHAKALAVACPLCGHVGKLNYQSGKASCLRCSAFINQKSVVRRIKGGRNNEF